MNVVIIGQKWLAQRLFKLCLDNGHKVLCVVAPNPNDRLFEAACEAGVTAFDRLPPADGLPECDVILAAHAHVFIGAAVRQRAAYGAVGYHPSLLPRHRGRDAVRWAVQMRETVTGGTLYRMDDGADTGAVLLQDWCFIRPDDTAQSLWQRELAPMGLRLFERFLQQPDLPALPQDEALATWEPAFGGGKLADKAV